MGYTESVKTAFAILLGIVLTVTQTVMATASPHAAKEGCCGKGCQCPPDCAQPAPSSARLPSIPVRPSLEQRAQAPAAPTTVLFRLPEPLFPTARPAADLQPAPTPVPLHQRNCVFLI
jgi:hypothetical protein